MRSLRLPDRAWCEAAIAGPAVERAQNEVDGQVQDHGEEHGRRELAPAAQAAASQEWRGHALDPFHHRGDGASLLPGEDQRRHHPLGKPQPGQGKHGVNRNGDVKPAVIGRFHVPIVAGRK